MTASVGSSAMYVTTATGSTSWKRRRPTDWVIGRPYLSASTFTNVGEPVDIARVGLEATVGTSKTEDLPDVLRED